MRTTSSRLPLEYVLPMRWTDDLGLAELVEYLDWLSRRVDVTVVDGSPPECFARHAAALPQQVRHVPVAPTFRYANGKVNGVLTGLGMARHEYVVIADDDVRYDERGLRQIRACLADADLVRPQNYFSPLPWHARWDTARSLLNRGVDADYPGTLAVRRSTFTAIGGYDGDVLFENLELIRTVHAYGGRESRPADLYVRRVPPEADRFWSQRVRQAYDDLAQPARLAAFLTVLPALAAAALTRRATPVVLATAGTIALAERGRRRAGGSAVFPATASLMAPVWVLERAVCSWVALGQRLVCGGVRYGDRRLRVAANSRRALIRRAAARRAAAWPPVS